MAKITLSPVANITNVAAINSNFEKIATEINNKMFSRNPEGEPNVLDTNIDLNGYKILNVPAPTAPTDLVRLQDLEDNVEVDLSTKQDVLVSGVNIKTVNNQSVLGSGNLEITATGSNDHNLALNRTLPDQHPISSITGLQASLDGKANTTHSHDTSDVTGLSTALNGKQDTLVSGSNIKTVNGNSLVGSGDVSITTGESNTASNLGAGTSVFAAKVGVDLQFKSLVAGTNVTLSNDVNTVTINSTASGGTSDHSALTNRNIADQHPISAITGLQSALDGKASTTHTHVISDVTGLQTTLDGKQETLVSGTNIKTVNGNSLLGSGDLVISGGGGSSDWVAASANFTANTNTSYFVTASTILEATLATPAVGKFFSISNNPASTSNIRIVKTGLTVASAKGTIGSADNILLKPGQHFYAYATSSSDLKVNFNG